VLFRKISIIFVYFENCKVQNYIKPFPVDARTKAFVCSRSVAGIVGSNPVGTCMSVCCQVEIPASGRPLVQMCPVVRGVSGRIRQSRPEWRFATRGGEWL